MPSLNVKAAHLEYCDKGEGEPLVMVHGSASDHRTWRFQREAFAERFRAVSYSRRYHWPNEPIPEGCEYSMAEHVDDLEAILRRLDAAPAHLVGHSYGAFLCLLLAMRHPGFVRSLVLAEPPVVTLFVSPVPKPLELLKLWLTRPRTAAALTRFGAKAVAPATRAFRKGDLKKGARIFGDAILGPGGFGRMSESRKAQVEDNLSTVRAELLGPGFLPLDAPRVRDVEASTLLVTGGESIGLFHRLADRLEQLLPRARRVEIPQGAHMMHEESPGAFNAVVLDFVSARTHEPLAGRRIARGTPRESSYLGSGPETR